MHAHSQWEIEREREWEGERKNDKEKEKNNTQCSMSFYKLLTHITESTENGRFSIKFMAFIVCVCVFALHSLWIMVFSSEANLLKSMFVLFTVYIYPKQQ